MFPTGICCFGLQESALQHRATLEGAEGWSDPLSLREDPHWWQNAVDFPELVVYASIPIGLHPSTGGAKWVLSMRIWTKLGLPGCL